MNPNLTPRKCDTSSNEDEIRTRAFLLLLLVVAATHRARWAAKLVSIDTDCVMVFVVR